MFDIRSFVHHVALDESREVPQWRLARAVEALEPDLHLFMHHRQHL